MIMINDITMNNYTAQAVPTWMNADSYDQLLGVEKEASLFNRIAAFLRH